MDDRMKSVARTCLEGAEGNMMTFPQIVATLIQEGFESYAVDFRRAVATYYLAEGEGVELPAHKIDVPVAPTFDAASIQAAIKEARNWWMSGE